MESNERMRRRMRRFNRRNACVDASTTMRCSGLCNIYEFFGNYFVSLDANYTESDLDIGDSTIEAVTVTPRIGIRGSLGDLKGALYIGAQYQDVDENQNGTAIFPIAGNSVPVGYSVVSEAEEEWNYVVGLNIENSSSWNYGVEFGFSERKHVMATLNYRF